MATEPATSSVPADLPIASLAGRVASDGMANLLRFAVTALSVLAVTPVIARTLDPGPFSVWTLVVSISTYIALAEAGTTSAVTRFVSADLVSTGRETPSVLASAFWLLALTGSIAVILLSAMSLGTTWLFRDIPDDLLGTARASVIVLAISVAVGILGTALQGYFFAIQRAIVPAVITIIARVGIAVGLFVTVLVTKSVLVLAFVMLGGATVSTVLTVTLVRRHQEQPITSPRLVRRAWLRNLAVHSSTLAGWSLAMVAITGLDIVVVGAFDFDAVGAYGIAAQGVALILGLFGAAMMPLTALAAKRHAERSPEQVARVLLDFSRVAVTLLVLASGMLFVGAPWVVGLYAGDAYVDTGATVLRILLVGNVIRNTCAPLGAVLVATGEHRRVLAPPFVEAALNVVLSLWWVQRFGADGVAWATAVAAAVAVGLHLALTIRNTRAFKVERPRFAAAAILRPSSVLVPVAVVMLTLDRTDVHPSVSILVTAVLGGATAWFVSLRDTDRETIRRVLGPYLAKVRR